MIPTMPETRIGSRKNIMPMIVAVNGSVNAIVAALPGSICARPNV